MPMTIIRNPATSSPSMEQPYTASNLKPFVLPRLTTLPGFEQDKSNLALPAIPAQDPRSAHFRAATSTSLTHPHPSRTPWLPVEKEARVGGSLVGSIAPLRE